MNNKMVLFLPCAAGVEHLLAEEAGAIASLPAGAVQPQRGGVRVRGGSWRTVMQLNLHSRMAQRVLVQLAVVPYAREDDLYAAAGEVPWETWF
nr:class I SAM-dependent RNA methyltransferase [Brachymonas sp.]